MEVDELIAECDKGSHEAPGGGWRADEAAKGKPKGRTVNEWTGNALMKKKTEKRGEFEIPRVWQLTTTDEREKVTIREMKRWSNVCQGYEIRADSADPTLLISTIQRQVLQVGNS